MSRQTWREGQIRLVTRMISKARGFRRLALAVRLVELRNEEHV